MTAPRYGRGKNTNMGAQQEAGTYGQVQSGHDPEPYEKMGRGRERGERGQPRPWAGEFRLGSRVCQSGGPCNR